VLEKHAASRGFLVTAQLLSLMASLRVIENSLLLGWNQGTYYREVFLYCLSCVLGLFIFQQDTSMPSSLGNQPPLERMTSAFILSDDGQLVTNSTQTLG